MDSAERHVLVMLSDGAWHSGERLAVELGLGLDALRDRVERIHAAGIDVQMEPGRGYRIPGGLELLDAARASTELSDATRRQLADITVLASVDSTNRWLYDEAQAGAASGHVCLAEMQTAGRGRHGRSWVSPFGTNVYCSVLWRFDAGPMALGGLSLAVGVAVVRALERAGVSGVGIKWPNDLLWEDRKLAGVLVEATGDARGPGFAVAGVGINRFLSDNARRRVDQPFAELRDLPGGRTIGRNRLAGLLVDEMFGILNAFSNLGFESCRADYERLDLLRGRAVRLMTAGRVLEAEALGVDDAGRLRALLPEGERTFASGEISLRPAS